MCLFRPRVIPGQGLLVLQHHAACADEELSGQNQRWQGDNIFRHVSPPSLGQETPTRHLGPGECWPYNFLGEQGIEGFIKVPLIDWGAGKEQTQTCPQTLDGKDLKNHMFKPLCQTLDFRWAHSLSFKNFLEELIWSIPSPYLQECAYTCVLPQLWLLWRTKEFPLQPVPTAVAFPHKDHIFEIMLLDVFPHLWPLLRSREFLFSITSHCSGLSSQKPHPVLWKRSFSEALIQICGERWSWMVGWPLFVIPKGCPCWALWLYLIVVGKWKYRGSFQGTWCCTPSLMDWKSLLILEDLHVHGTRHLHFKRSERHLRSFSLCCSTLLHETSLAVRVLANDLSNLSFGSLTDHCLSGIALKAVHCHIWYLTEELDWPFLTDFWKTGWELTVEKEVIKFKEFEETARHGIKTMLHHQGPVYPSN